MSTQGFTQGVIQAFQTYLKSPEWKKKKSKKRKKKEKERKQTKNLGYEFFWGFPLTILKQSMKKNYLIK